MPVLHEFWDPNDWELHAFGLLQDRHGATSVMKVPARHKGDFGVDYYCVSGRVAYQCYAVQEPCDVDDRATKQKAKITKDLKKFCTRAELASLFVGNKVERWILVVPIHDSAQVNLHLSAKTAQVRALGLAYVATDFEVLVHDLECFDPASLELRAFHRRQISLPPQPATTAQIDSWTRASNPLVTALSKKLVKRIGSGDPAQLDSAVQEMVGLFLEKENSIFRHTAMPPDFLGTLLDGPFELTSRPEPVPGDLRMAWGIALIILILGRSRGKRASLQKLHFMAHSARTKESREEVRRVFTGDRGPADLVVRVEPWLNRAIAFATAAGLITLERGRSLKLTDDGLKTLERISSAELVMTEERTFLDVISPRATEAAVEKVMRMERLL